MEYICETVYSEVVECELLAIVKECMMEEWSSGDWSAVSTAQSDGVDHSVCL